MFKSLLRIPSVNTGPAGPGAGDERACADWCADRLRECGIEVRIFDSAPNRRSLVACIGKWDDSSALLISGHLDVVPVDEAKWSQKPFSGAEAQDKFGVPCIWGRLVFNMCRAPEGPPTCASLSSFAQMLHPLPPPTEERST